MVHRATEIKTDWWADPKNGYQDHFGDLARLAIDLSGASFASIDLFDGKKQFALARSGFGQEELLAEGVRAALGRRRTPLLLDDSLADMRYRDFLKTSSNICLRSWIIVPLLSRAKLAGVLWVSDSTPNFFHEKQIPSLQALGRQTARLLEEFVGRSKGASPLQDNEVEDFEVMERLMQASHRFLELFQGLPIACFCFDAEGRIHEWNRASETLYGYSASDVLQKPLWEVICPSDSAIFARTTVKKVLAGKTFEGLEWTNTRADGSKLDVLCNTFPLRALDGTVAGGIIANFDISSRKLAEGDMQEAYSQLDLRIQQRTAELAKANKTLRREAAERNKAEAELREDADRLAALIGVQYEIASAELDQEKVMQLICDRTRDLSRADLCLIWLIEGSDISARAISGSSKFPVGTRVSSDSGLSGHCIRTGEIVYTSDAWSDSRANQSVAKLTKARSVVVVPIHYGMEIAGTFVVTSRKVDAFDEKDIQILQLMAGLISTAMEHVAQFEERREAEHELQRILAQTEQILISIPSILIGIDERMIVTTWNMSATRALGLARDSVLGKPLSECEIDWETETLFSAIEACRLDGHPVRLDDVRLHAAGKDRLLGVTITPITTPAGSHMGFLILAADITERRALESQLAHSQKLESIGQLAAGIAHEINTPIQYVGDNVRFLQTAFSDIAGVIAAYSEFTQRGRAAGVSDDLIAPLEEAMVKADVDYLMQEAPAAISQSLEGVQRVAHIVGAMKEFSHPGTAEKTRIDLNHALESTITVARHEWKYVAEIVTDLDPELPLVSCLPADLNQAFLNLIVNAAHAIGDVVNEGAGEKGTITVRTRNLRDAVEISISDTGTGIPPAVQSRLFDPFFTTKGVGKGTGQGLTIARSVVVDKHGGTIDFKSKSGEGTTFIIKLPIQPAEERQSAA